VQQILKILKSLMGIENKILTTVDVELNHKKPRNLL